VKETCGYSCDEIQAQLCTLLDPGTSPEQARALLDSIAECPTCYGRLESEREIRAILQRCCTAEAAAPASLRQRISMQIRVTRFQG
jgi:mycothiol system anti-sigma-R factor